MGRTASGVKGIDIPDDVNCVSADVISEDDEILIITEKGYGKRTNVREYRLTHRGSKGVKALNVTDKNGNMTVPSAVTAATFKSDSTEAAIKPSDSNEVNFGSNTNYIYFGYDNRVGSTGKVDTYKFGTHSGASNSTSGNIECGSVKVGSAKMTYDSANECLNFVFV